MTHDELLKLLDLGGKEALPPADAPSALIATDPTPPSPALSSTALAVDVWGLRRGRDLLAESERLRRLDLGEHAAADFFAAAFDPDPVLLPSCADPRRHEFLAQLLETPDYRVLHQATRLDDTAASIAAAHLAEQFAALKGEDAAAASADTVGSEMAALRAAARAVAGAEAEVGELSEARAAMGLGPGEPGSADPAAVAALFRRVRSDPALGRICELAGRFRRVAQSRQRQKAAHGLDDVVGVTTGGDVSRLLPAELARLMIPEMELETLRRIAERQAFCREHHAVEPVGKGPIVVVVDESGSMSGEKVHTAKALALALAWVARRQRRWCGLVAYSGDSGERVLALPPGRWDEAALADWLSAFIGRGSSLDLPLRELPRMYAQLGAPAGVTDVLMVTDAQCLIPADVREQFNAWRAGVRARVVALVVGAAPGDLAAVCDEAHQVRVLSADDPAVESALSL